MAPKHLKKVQLLANAGQVASNRLLPVRTVREAFATNHRHWQTTVLLLCVKTAYFSLHLQC